MKLMIRKHNEEDSIVHLFKGKIARENQFEDLNFEISKIQIQ